ncbi:MAG: TatD family hydrolase [Solirubrobacterales bacterium]
MVDTHAHLTLCEPPAAELLEAARSAGVERVLTVGIDAASVEASLRLAARHPEVFAAVGRHPNLAAGFSEADAEAIAGAAASPGARAVGETGLDFYRDGAPRADQRAAFEAQIRIAAGARLPLVIHVRDPEGSTEAVDEVFETLDRLGTGLEVILHCFSAPDRVADAAERGWHCSFAGNVTYPSAERLRDAAARVPDGLILLETDSPYLSPQPRRGRPNQPANVVETAAVVAEARGSAPESLEGLVDANARRLFGW